MQVSTASSLFSSRSKMPNMLLCLKFLRKASSLMSSFNSLKISHKRTTRPGAERELDTKNYSILLVLRVNVQLFI